NAQNEIGEGLSGEVAAKVKAATPQARDRPRCVLLIARQRESGSRHVLAVSPGHVAGIVELVGNVPLSVEISIPESRQRNIGERQAGRSLKLWTRQGIVDSELIVIPQLAGVRA